MNEHEYLIEFERLLRESVRRLAGDKKEVEMAFSGGLDSSVLAKILIDSGYKVKGYVVGTRDCKDVKQARRAAGELRVDLEVIELGEKDIEDAIGIQGRIIKNVYDSVVLDGKEENDNLTPNAIPISFNLPLFFVAKHARNKLVFVSQGPDEMLGGYKRIEKMEKPDALKEMSKNTEDFLKFGIKQNFETGRYWKKEFVMPYLESLVVDFCLDLPYGMRINNSRKYILRKLALRLGIPEEILVEKKAAQYGSGIIDVMKKLARARKHHISWLVKEKIEDTDSRRQM